MIDYISDVIEAETEYPIFPRGVHQLLGWAYAMEGVSPHEKSIHQKMIERVNTGDVRPFPTSGINLKGLKLVQIHGLAAGIRQRVEDHVSDDQRYVIWAKYCDEKCEESMKRKGMAAFAQELTRTLRRDKEFLKDCIWHVVCTDQEKEVASMYAIGKMHGTSAMSVHRATVQIRREMRKSLDSSEPIIRKIFANDGVF